MKFMSSLLAATILSASLGLAPAVARAQDRDPSVADTLFEVAREAMARGDFAAACPRFAESHRLDPAPGTLLNLAKCEEEEGQLAASYAHLNEALDTLAKDDFRVAYAREQLASLKRRIPTVTVTLAKTTPGAHVLRDGLELREGSFGVPLPLDPGRHVFVVRAEGHAEAREEVTLHEGEHERLVLSVGPRANEGNAATTVTPSEAGGGRRTLALGALGVGGAGLVTGIVTGLMFSSAVSTYREHCDASGCDAEGLDAASRGKTLDVVSPIAFGVGVVGLGVGTYLLLTRSPRRTNVKVGPQVSGQAAGLTLSGGF